MAAEEPLLIDLVDAVLEGRPVDWDAAESIISESERALLADLRAVAGIASFHAQSSAGEHFRAAVSDLASVSPPLANSDVPSSSSTNAATVDAIPEGATWGSLKVLERVGQGAFGDVYRAQDSRLDRVVALKLIHRLESLDSIASHVIDEGRLLARVRHPNVVTVYGADRIDGRVGLWMEFVRGRTLEAVLRDQGPFGAQEATLIGLDLCRALSAVHGAGLIHRDVKAQNVMREAGGRIVLMDFGTGLEHLSDGPADLAGTPLYLAPEVLGGAPATVPSDIYSLGVLLFHLVTGAYPVKGRTAADLREAHGQRRRGRLRDARPDLSDTFVQAVECALDVEPDKRYETAGAMESALSRVMASSASAAAPQKARLKYLSLAIAAAAALLAIGGATAWSVLRRSDPPDVARITFEVATPWSPAANQIALSPDGKHLAAIVPSDVNKQIWVRALERLNPAVLNGTEGAISPFWSPDGRVIAFFADGKLKKIDISGALPQTLADAPHGLGGTWNRDGVIVFAPASVGPLFRVPASGGVPVQATELDPSLQEEGHRQPQFLPDGTHFLFLATSASAAHSAIYVGSLASKERKRLVSATEKALFAPPDHILFMRDGTLMAQRFDAARLELGGTPFPVAEDVSGNSVNGQAAFTASETGLLAYRQTVAPADTALTWFDRKGARIGVLGERAPYDGVQLSHDGTRAAVIVFDPAQRSRDVWLYDVARGSGTRFTFDPEENTTAIWSADDRRIVFSSGRQGLLRLYVKDASGGGAEEELLGGFAALHPDDWAADGQSLLYTASAYSSTGSDLWMLPLSGNQKPVAFLQSPFSERAGRFSPDGRWVAYESNESGRYEVYVVSIDGSGGKWQISKGGGSFPIWRRDGREIFFLEGTISRFRLMATMVDGRGAAFKVGSLNGLFSGSARSYWNPYDVSADGQRILVNTMVGEEGTPPITVVVNWASGLGP